MTEQVLPISAFPLSSSLSNSFNIEFISQTCNFISASNLLIFLASNFSYLFSVFIVFPLFVFFVFFFPGADLCQFLLSR